MSKSEGPYGGHSGDEFDDGVNDGTKLAPPVKKLEAQGGDFGDEWDDGVHDNVRMITVTYDGPCVKSVKFEYANGTNTVFGDDHGYVDKDHKKKEFKLYLNNEYITSVKGHYGKKLPPPGTKRATMEAFGNEYMTMLKFKTNTATYQVLGSDTPGYEYVGTPFKLKEEGHKIVGFYGKSAYSQLEKIGVYVKPIDDA